MFFFPSHLEVISYLKSNLVPFGAYSFIPCTGTFRHRILRMLLPFWSSALPTLPVTAPSKKESDGPEGRPRQRSSRMDPTKILLAMAIL